MAVAGGFAEDVQLEVVAAVERFRLQLRGLRRRRDADVSRRAVMRGQRHRKVRDRRMARQLVEVQRDRHQHALGEMADGGHEDRAPRQAAVRHDLGHVLVAEAERVEFEGRRVTGLVLCDHRLAAAGIAGDRVDRERRVGREPALIDQRPDQGDGARRVAAGVRHHARRPDRRLLPDRQFGKAVGPVRRGAMRGRGVEHLRAVRHRGDQRGGLAGGLVGQAQDDEIDLGQQRALGLDALAVGVGQALQHDIAASGEALPDAEPGGAGLAVDEDARRHAAILVPLRRVSPLGCARSRDLGSPSYRRSALSCSRVTTPSIAARQQHASPDLARRRCAFQHPAPRPRGVRSGRFAENATWRRSRRGRASSKCGSPAARGGPRPAPSCARP